MTGFTSTKDFGGVAKALAHNPLGVIALFIVLIYGFAALVSVFGSAFSEFERTLLVLFLVLFPVVVLGIFVWLVVRHASKLFSPADFRDEANYVKMYAAAALGAATSKSSAADVQSTDLERIVRTVEDVKTPDRPTNDGWRKRVLWVDDRPENNVYLRQAFEALGLDILLSLNTSDALDQLSRKTFAAIISDMGRKEGPREGYVLLEKVRESGIDTPLFFYAGSNAPEHKAETVKHGGQGCTNDPNELFEMITRAVINS